MYVSPPTPHVAGTWEEKQSAGLGISWRTANVSAEVAARRPVGNFGLVNSRDTPKNNIPVVFTFCCRMFGVTGEA